MEGKHLSIQQLVPMTLLNNERFDRMNVVARKSLEGKKLTWFIVSWEGRGIPQATFYENESEAKDAMEVRKVIEHDCYLRLVCSKIPFLLQKP